MGPGKVPTSGGDPGQSPDIVIGSTCPTPGLARYSEFSQQRELADEAGADTGKDGCKAGSSGRANALSAFELNLGRASVVEDERHHQVYLVIDDLVVLDVDPLFLDPCAADVPGVLVARVTPCWMASSKPFGEVALISVTRATAIGSSFSYARPHRA